MGRCMNAFIFSVVLLAGIGILAALALGAYFALQPKPDSPKRSDSRTDFRIPADAFRKVQLDNFEENNLTSTAIPPTTKVKPTSPKLSTKNTTPRVAVGQFGPKVYAESDQTPRPEVKVQPPVKVQASTTQPNGHTPLAVKPTEQQVTSNASEATKKPQGEFGQLRLPENTENVVSDEEPVLSFPKPSLGPQGVNWSTKLIPPKVLPPKPESVPAPVRNQGEPLGNDGHEFSGNIPSQPTSGSRISSSSPTFAAPTQGRVSGEPSVSSTTQLSPSAEFQPPPNFGSQGQPSLELNPRLTVETQSRNSQDPDAALEKHLVGYQKIAGICYRNGYLYVPSYVNGQVSVLSTPDMNTLIEYECAECSIYDIAALSTGDMVAALGRNQELVKIDPLGNEIKRLSVNYATKGLAINGYNEIFVLSRTHKEVYVYNKDLEQVAHSRIPGKGAGDCNFMAVNDSDVLFVSCQEAVYVFSVNGDPIMKILPPKGVSYGVGMDIDANGNILVVRRGQGILDVYDRDGNYIEAVGEGVDTLWSDIAVGEEHLYVVDYIEAKIKVFRYN